MSNRAQHITNQLLETEEPDDVDSVLRQYAREPLEKVHIEGRRWFNRGPGNTYFSVDIWVNGNPLHRIQFHYGYGDQYLYAARDWLVQNGYLALDRPHESLWRAAERLGIKLTAEVYDVKRKRDL